MASQNGRYVLVYYKQDDAFVANMPKFVSINFFDFVLKYLLIPDYKKSLAQSGRSSVVSCLMRKDRTVVRADQYCDLSKVLSKLAVYKINYHLLTLTAIFGHYDHLFSITKITYFRLLRSLIFGH